MKKNFFANQEGSSQQWSRPISWVMEIMPCCYFAWWMPSHHLHWPHPWPIINHSVQLLTLQDTFVCSMYKLVSLLNKWLHNNPARHYVSCLTSMHWKLFVSLCIPTISLGQKALILQSKQLFEQFRSSTPIYKTVTTPSVNRGLYNDNGMIDLLLKAFNHTK